LEKIDWSIFDGDPELTCTCRCGAQFRSHAKFVSEGNSFRHYSQKPCPGCGRHDNISGIRSDWERFSLGG